MYFYKRKSLYMNLNYLILLLRFHCIQLCEFLNYNLKYHTPFLVNYLTFQKKPCHSPYTKLS